MLNHGEDLNSIQVYLEQQQHRVVSVGSREQDDPHGESTWMTMKPVITRMVIGLRIPGAVRRASCWMWLAPILFHPKGWDVLADV